MYISIIDECHLRFCRCCSCGFLLCLCSFSLVFGKPNAIDHPQVMTMFTGINPKWWAYYWPHITQFPSFQSESKHTVQVETWELCQTLPLLLPASWQPLPWNKSGVLLRVKPSEKWWCLPCACNCSSWVSYQIFSRGSRQSQSKRPSCFFSSNNFRKTKTATAPLAAKIVQYYGPEKIRHNMLELSRIAKFRSKKLWFCTTITGRRRTRLTWWRTDNPSIWFAHLVGSPSPPSRLWLWTLAILHQDFPQTSLPKISVQSASRKSHRARRSTNFNYSSTLRLKIVKQKKGKPLGKP